MYLGKTVAVVVPGHDEANFVGDVIDTLPSVADRAYVVDDCSNDDTWEVIRAHAARANAARSATPSVGDTETESVLRSEFDDDSRTPAEALSDGGALTGDSDGGALTGDFVVPIRHETNLGRGAAVKTGYRAALEDGIDVIAVMDADGQMDPDIFEDIIDPVARGEADYAVGNRLTGPASWADMPGHRLFGNVILTLLTRIASGYWHILDPQNGYTAISAEALRAVDLGALYDDYGFLNDLLVRLNVADMPVVNVPMRARYGDEESGIDYRTFVPKLSMLLLKDFLWRLWRKYVPSGNPVAISYVVGAVVTLLGFLGVLRSLASFETPSGRSVKRAVGGALGLVLAMVLDSQESKRRGLRGSRKRRE
ncbi:glycosyltransferase family 2 protein (plasmid) [Haloferax larsenii]|uniref:Glycosyltransferase family 2 protein n=1 Tax=Haloferax larsenii TaxID=302484 RepID=A0ABY5RJ94_HALLR|nr:glycosyltransferase family 2 protein [Haloferax larsenii]UVE52437.1 glycosyltransferase family 2 protein [Haloferax larsenii]